MDKMLDMFMGNLGAAGVLMAVVTLLLFALKIYGVVTAFRKKWYMGAAALFVPFFAEIVAIAKIVFKKDLLKE